MGYMIISGQKIELLTSEITEECCHLLVWYWNDALQSYFHILHDVFHCFVHLIEPLHDQCYSQSYNSNFFTLLFHNTTRLGSLCAFVYVAHGRLLLSLISMSAPGSTVCSLEPVIGVVQESVKWSATPTRTVWGWAPDRKVRKGSLKGLNTYILPVTCHLNISGVILGHFSR